MSEYLQGGDDNHRPIYQFVDMSVLDISGSKPPGCPKNDDTNESWIRSLRPASTKPSSLSTVHPTAPKLYRQISDGSLCAARSVLRISRAG